MSILISLSTTLCFQRWRSMTIPSSGYELQFGLFGEGLLSLPPCWTPQEVALGQSSHSLLQWTLEMQAYVSKHQNNFQPSATVHIFGLMVDICYPLLTNLSVFDLILAQLCLCQPLHAICSIWAPHTPPIPLVLLFWFDHVYKISKHSKDMIQYILDTYP